MTASTSSVRKSRFPIAIRVEPRMQTPAWLPATLSIGAVGLALLIGGIIIAVYVF